MADSRNQMYVGYLPLPQGMGSSVRRFALLWFLLMAGMAVLVAWKQQDPGPGVWNLGDIVELEGTLMMNPYPILYQEVEGEERHASAVLLCSQLKFGATDRAAEWVGQRVRARGNFISYDGRRMFELVDGSGALQPMEGGGARISTESVGARVMTGEIVDSKCFLGVMKPGFGKTHRGCAVRCISGGITPLFITRGEDSELEFYVLKGTQGEAVNEAVLPYVAEPVTLSGHVERHGDLLHFAADITQIERR